MRLKTILIAIWVVVILPTTVFAFFKDTHTSTDNFFSATTLDTRLTPSNPSPIVRNILYGGTPEQKVEFSFILMNTGGMNTQNRLQAINISNPTFASKISVEVILDDITSLYSGDLNSLLTNSYLTQIPSQTNKIGLTFTISEANYLATPQESVSFRLQNHAWQTNQTYGNGFFDNEYVDVQITNNLPIPQPSPLLENFVEYNPLNILQE